MAFPSSGGAHQLVYDQSGIWIRSYTGNPLAWTNWVKQPTRDEFNNLSAYSSVDITFESSLSLNSSSEIYAYLMGRKLLFVSGYLNSTVNIPNNSFIARLSNSAYKPAFDTFTSAVPSKSNSSPGRLVLRSAGRIQIESEFTAETWYSFSFVCVLQ